MTDETRTLVANARRYRADGWPLTAPEADALIAALDEVVAERDRMLEAAFAGIPTDPMRVTGRGEFVR